MSAAQPCFGALLSMLLLIAGGALVLTTSMSATNAIDSTAEMQAYYGAEAGLQSTINVLRGNVWNGAGTPTVNFRSAVEPASSNAASDPATGQSIARLSNWLSYTDAAAYPSRVIANGEVGTNAIAYDVTARDLDDSKVVRSAHGGDVEVESPAARPRLCAHLRKRSKHYSLVRLRPPPATSAHRYPSANPV